MIVAPSASAVSDLLKTIGAKTFGGDSTKGGEYVVPRIDTATNWTANNPVLNYLEVGYELDTGKTKIGNSVTAWNALAYTTFNGDLSSNTATSVDSELVIFSGTGGKTVKRATVTGLAKLASGVLSAAVAGTDYYNPGGTDVAVTDGGTGRSTSTTAYGIIAAGTTATGAHQTLATGTSGQILKSNGSAALPTFQTGAPSDVALGNVDNTSDATKNSATATLTNKRITARVTTIVSSATPTINTDNCDAVTITALATAITSMTSSLSGTPANFDKLTIRIKDDGTARAIAWGASFASRGGTLPTTTVISKVTTVGLIYNTVTSTWDCVAVAQEA